MVKKISIGIVLIILGVVIAAMLQPAEFRVTRSATMTAPASKVFAQLNDFHRWEAWSPWAQLDPQAKNTFSGAPSGTGSTFSWAGNRHVGEGRMTILESRPNEYLKLALEFIKPFPGISTTEFILKQENPQNTNLAWSMHGRNNFIARIISVFMNCDKMIGGQFEKGLANIKAIVESPQR